MLFFKEVFSKNHQIKLKNNKCLIKRKGHCWLRAMDCSVRTIQAYDLRVKTFIFCKNYIALYSKKI